MSIRPFSYKEIQLATNYFDHKRILGQGAYGIVYEGSVEEGVFEDGTTTVAVKQLSNNTGEVEVVQQFESEVAMLSKLRHYRIVSLLGYCDYTHDGIFRELILVYEYMPGGTVADRLYNRSGDKQLPPLSWEERINICIGAAEGLNYLHTGTDPVSRIIHCDMKSSNILLNDKLESKVADFGLSKLTPPGKSYYVTDSARGTDGYHDRAFRKTNRLTEESDVYSFGVVLLEMLCGRAARDPDPPQGKRYLTEWAKPLIETAATSTVTENVIRRFVDVSINNDIEWDCLVVYMQLVKDCLHKNPKKRRKMFDVVAQLWMALKLQVGRRVTDIFSDGNHSSDGNSTDSDIHHERMVRARRVIYNSQGSSSSASSFMVDERIDNSNLDVIEEENFNVNEGDGGSGNMEEGGHQYENNIDVTTPTRPPLPQYLSQQTRWLTNAVSGVSVGDHGQKVYMELRRHKKHRYVIYKIDEKKNEVVVEKTGDRADIHSQFVASLPEDDCRFAIYDLDFLHFDTSRTIKILLIHWSPSGSKTRAKVLYALSLCGLKRDLEGIHKEVQANTLSDISLPDLMSRC